ncbi:MAG: NAD(P)-binding domain-containing protein [Proteobacteria bacterium]|nr:NAD(P)-binding domain-containing protein [Pseudomonadota bacterium]
MYSLIFSIILLALVMGVYLLIKKKKTEKIEKKIAKAKEYGLHEPVSIHPYIDPAKCIGSGACVKACPEKDIIGLSGGKGVTINASQCIGHGACAAACPVGAITLVFGTETRGVDIPYVSPNFETNIEGVYIVGELGGMGLIKNAITQGREAIEYISSALKEEGNKDKGSYDVIIVGAGPAGIGASLAAFKQKLSFLTIEQGDIGGTVFNYPRNKVVMTSPVELPTYGKVKLKEARKEELLELWMDVINKTGLKINVHEKMLSINKHDKGHFKVGTSKGEYKSRKVILAIGRRGTPRKLGVPGEDLPKITYRLLDAEQHENHNVLVVGGGDSAVEAALAIADQPGNRVILSYRKDAFSRVKPKNKELLDRALAKKSLKVALNSNVKEIREKDVKIAIGDKVGLIKNDYVYIFAGGELPNEFLKSIGIKIERKFGTA